MIRVSVLYFVLWYSWWFSLYFVLFLLWCLALHFLCFCVTSLYFSSV